MMHAPITPLGPYRVLDLSGEWGFLCGKILGDLGADVIKIEPPGGDPERRRGPFLEGEGGRGKGTEIPSAASSGTPSTPTSAGSP